MNESLLLNPFRGTDSLVTLRLLLTWVTLVSVRERTVH